MAELFDIVVRRQIYVEGLKHAKGQEFAATLANLRRELADRLRTFEYPDLGDATKGAIMALIVDLRKIAQRVFDPYLTALIDWLKEFVSTDVDLLGHVFGEAVPSAAKRLQDQKPDRLWALAIGAPMAATGTLMLPFITALLPSVYVKLQRLTMQTYANRETRDDLIKAIVGSDSLPLQLMPGTEIKTYRDGMLRQLQAQGVAATNTVIQHLAAQTNAKLGSKLFGFYEWVSVLDNKTTLICFHRDGNRYEYGKGPVPPAHVNCRSTTVPVRLNAPATPNSFADWISGQPDEFVKDALDGHRGGIYERSSPIGLDAYGRKGSLIGA